MSMFRKNAAALGIFAAMAASSSEENIYGEPRAKDPKRMSPSELKQHVDLVKKKRELKRVERLKKRGLKQFFYGDNYVMAINQKTADKKAKKKGYLK